MVYDLPAVVHMCNNNEVEWCSRNGATNINITSAKFDDAQDMCYKPTAVHKVSSLVHFFHTFICIAYIHSISIFFLFFSFISWLKFNKYQLCKEYVHRMFIHGFVYFVRTLCIWIDVGVSACACYFV